MLTTDNGDIYLTGNYYYSPFDVDKFSITNDGILEATSDAFLLKMDKNLDVQWLNKVTGKYSERGYKLARDNNGNLYWAVEYSSKAVTYTSTQLQGDKANAFVAKLNPDGEVLWLQNLTADEVISLRDIDADAAGNLWVAVNFGAQLSFAGQTTTTAGGWDNVTMQLDRDDGHLLQHYHITGPEQQSIYQVQALSDNSLLLVGAFSSDTLSFLNVNLPNTAQGSSFLDFFATLQLPTVGTSSPSTGEFSPLLLWPNPLGLQSALTVRLPAGGGTIAGEVSVYNFIGQLAGRFPVDPAIRQVLIPPWYFRPGVYTVTYGPLSGILVVVD